MWGEMHQMLEKKKITVQVIGLGRHFVKIKICQYLFHIPQTAIPEPTTVVSCDNLSVISMTARDCILNSLHTEKNFNQKFESKKYNSSTFQLNFSYVLRMPCLSKFGGRVSLQLITVILFERKKDKSRPASRTDSSILKKFICSSSFI